MQRTRKNIRHLTNKPSTFSCDRGSNNLARSLSSASSIADGESRKNYFEPLSRRHSILDKFCFRSTDRRKTIAIEKSSFETWSELRHYKFATSFGHSTFNIVKARKPNFLETNQKTESYRCLSCPKPIGNE